MDYLNFSLSPHSFFFFFLCVTEKGKPFAKKEEKKCKSLKKRAFCFGFPAWVSLLVHIVQVFLFFLSSFFPFFGCQQYFGGKKVDNGYRAAILFFEFESDASQITGNYKWGSIFLIYDPFSILIYRGDGN